MVSSSRNNSLIMVPKLITLHPKSPQLLADLVKQVAHSLHDQWYSDIPSTKGREGRDGPVKLQMGVSQN